MLMPILETGAWGLDLDLSPSPLRVLVCDFVLQFASASLEGLD